MYFLGDTHEQQRTIDICKTKLNINNIIFGVGDHGIGWGGEVLKLPTNFLHIMGNHDNPVKSSPNFVGRWGAIPVYTSGRFYNVLFISGAESVDKDLRIDGVNWWNDEELGYTESGLLIDFLENYINTIDVVVTPDCPDFITGYYSSTSRLLSVVHKILETKNGKYAWVFGHHHKIIKAKKGKATFRGLEIDELISLDDIWQY